MLQKNFELKNGQILIIKEPEPEEAPQILEYVNKIAGEIHFLTTNNGQFEVSIEQERQFVKEYQNSANKLFIIAKVGDVLVGSLTFTGGAREKTMHTGEFDFSVMKKYWGWGIGSKLVDTVIEWAKSTQVIKKINLRVRSDNDGAIAVYKRLGFAMEGLILRDICINEEFFDNVFMGLKID